MKSVALLLLGIFALASVFSPTFGLAGTLPPPALLLPIDGASIRAAPVSFSWTAVAEANNYRLQVARQSDPESPVTDKFTKDISFVAPSLTSGVYVWRVKARIDQFDKSDWTAYRKFSITGSAAVNR